MPYPAPPATGSGYSSGRTLDNTPAFPDGCLATRTRPGVLNWDMLPPGQRAAFPNFPGDWRSHLHRERFYWFVAVRTAAALLPLF